MASLFRLQQAANILRLGGVIAYPTAGVWGLGCDPNNTQALQSLISIKQRDSQKGLILVANHSQQFAPYLEGLAAEQHKALSHYWQDGRTTVIVPNNGYAHPLLMGGFNSIALRVSHHKTVVGLCEAFGGAIVSTSANLAGREACQWPWQVHSRLGEKIDYIVGGQTAKAGRPSRIIELTTGAVLRP